MLLSFLFFVIVFAGVSVTVVAFVAEQQLLYLLLSFFAAFVFLNCCKHIAAATVFHFPFLVCCVALRCVVSCLFVLCRVVSCPAVSCCAVLYAQPGLVFYFLLLHLLYCFVQFRTHTVLFLVVL